MQRIAFVESNLSGTGFQALHLAKELGYQVLFLTRNLTYYQHLSAAQDISAASDEVIICETNDPDSILTALRSRADLWPLNGVITFADYYVQITAEVARRLNLPGLSPQAAALGRNKLWARQACQEAGIPLPQFASAATVSEALEAAQRIGLPCVVKPVDAAASVDVLLCRSLAEVEHQLERIRGRPVNTRGQQRFPAVLIEELLLGYEISVETMTWQGQTTVIGVTDKHLSPPPSFVELGHTFPSTLPQAVTTQCAALARHALAAIGFDFGPAHVECKITAAGPMLIEINPRLAGDRIADLVEYSLGLSLVKETLRMHMGEVPDLHPGKATPQGAAIRFFSAPPGIICSLSGQDLAERLPGIIEVALEVQVGQTVRPLRNNTDCLGHVITVGETSALADRFAEAAQLLVEIHTEQGG